MFMMIENALLHELSMNKESQSDCVQSRHIYPSFVLVQPRKTCPYISERLLMGRKESNQTNKQRLCSAYFISAINQMLQPAQCRR